MPTESHRDRIVALNQRFRLPDFVSVCLHIEPSSSAAREVALALSRHDHAEASILKLCNSPLRGDATAVRNVQEAVERLGLCTVQSLLISSCVPEVFREVRSVGSTDCTQFWRHSIETALVAQMLAERVGHTPPQEAFVAGLLHDVGLILMADLHGDRYGSFLTGSVPHDDWLPQEHDQFGGHHAEAASVWCASQYIPTAICDAVRRHHDRGLGLRGAAPEDQLAMIVALADRVSHLGVEPRIPFSRHSVECKVRIVNALGLHPIDLTFASRAAIEALSETGAILGCDVGTEMDILKDANSRLRAAYADLEMLLLESPIASREELIHQVLEAICATFSHYINNATTTIMGHSELVEMAVRRGTLSDPDGRLVESMRMIENSVVNISAVLTEMKLLGKFDVIPYHDRAQILNIDEQVKRRIEQTQR